MVVGTIERDSTDGVPRDSELVIAIHTFNIPREGSFDYFRGLIHAYQDFCVDEAPPASQMFAICWILAFCRLYSTERIKITKWD